MTRKRQKPLTSVFTYFDFRKYLADVVEEFRTTREGFSVRDISEKAGFGSPSFLKMMIDGDRRLTDQSADKISDVFHITGREKEYFIALVHYSQCDHPDEKHKLLALLNALRPKATYSKTKTLQIRYLSNDYYSCIREMVRLKDFQENAKWIAAKCLPRIKPQEARAALNDLLEMGFLKRDSSGKLIHTELVIDTNLEDFGFHEAALNKARRQLSLLNQENREFTTLTLPLDSNIESEIRNKIILFQKDIQDLISKSNSDCNSVYQLNVQFFPITQEIKDKK